MTTGDDSNPVTVYVPLCGLIELQPVVEGMSAEGQKRAIVRIEGFLKARASYDATMRRLGLDDPPDAA